MKSLTRLEKLELSSLTRWIGAELNSVQALQRAIRCEQLCDPTTAEKFLRFAELKERDVEEGM